MQAGAGADFFITIAFPQQSDDLSHERRLATAISTAQPSSATATWLGVGSQPSGIATFQRLDPVQILADARILRREQLPLCEATLSKEIDSASARQT